MASLRQRCAVAAASFALVALSACGSSSPSDGGVESPDPAAETSAPALEGASTDRVTAESSDFGLLTDVRVAGHNGYDRVVFEFADDLLPGYTIEYVDLPIFEDGSGEPVDIPDASTALQILFTPSSSYDLISDEPGPSYTGPQEITPTDATHIVQVVNAGDFEAQMVWAIGLPSELPFTVTPMHAPARLVIDIQAP